MTELSSPLVLKRRPFYLSDVLVMIASTTLGLILFRRNWELYEMKQLLVAPAGGWTGMLLVNRVLYALLNLAVPMAAAWTLGVLAAWVSGPRTPLRRLGRQPGAVACAAVGLVMALSMAEYLIRVSLFGVEKPWDAGFSAETSKVLMDGLGTSYPRNGYAAAAAWLTLALGRRWRPDPTWIDRAGRTLAAFWIGSIALPLLFQILNHMTL